MKPSNIIVVIGPTGSGKSEYAAKLAKKIDGEIISVDSRQIYRGLDIGTAKVKGQLGTDIADPKKIYSIQKFKAYADKIISDMLGRKKIPILVGGTAFYIKAVADGIVIPQVPPNFKLRKRLEKNSLEKLQKILKKKDPARFQTIDIKNKRRIIRALEIIEALGKVPAPEIRDAYSAKYIGIKRSDKDLRKRIEARTKQMIKNGLISEIKRLRKKGISQKRLNEFGFEYKYPALFLQKRISREEMINRINKETLDYTRRQMLWWKKDKRIKWITPRQAISKRSP